MDIRLGIGLPQVVEGSTFDLGSLRDVLQTAEELGFHSAWVMDQVVPSRPVLDPIPLLGHAAAVTHSVRLATGVLLTALLHPVKLARELATADHLTGGRLILGVGLGARGSYDPVWGIPPSERAARFVEGLDLLEELWTKDRVTFSGRFWRVGDVAVRPKPLQRPRPPLWFGGGSRPAIERAVTRGDGWMGAGASTIAEFKQQAALVREILAETGHGRPTFGIAKRVYLCVTTDAERSRARMRAWSKEFYGDTAVVDRVAVVGDLDFCVGRLAEIAKAGADLIVLNPVFDVVDQMRLVAGAITAFTEI